MSRKTPARKPAKHAATPTRPISLRLRIDVTHMVRLYTLRELHRTLVILNTLTAGKASFDLEADKGRCHLVIE